jgi:DNA polymerase-1
VNRRPPRNGEIIEKTQNTLLVDGNALFKHGFFGAKNTYNEHGQHIGGLYAFLTILRMLLNNDLYHRVYVFWDGNLSGKLRYDIYEPYKSARGKDYINGTHPIDESELQQRRVIWDYLNDMYVRQLKDEIIESDDFIAYYCLTKKKNEKITICSTDRDFNQLISDDIRIYFLDLKEYVDSINFSSYFCYNQGNSMLMKMMTGDNSDSIKGIKGLQEKTLINLFPELTERKVSLDEIIESAKVQQLKRIEEKKKPLKILDNIIHKVTDGVQKDKIYEINERLVNLKTPFMTEDGIRELEQLTEGTLDSSGRDLKNVLIMMKRDGLDKTIGDVRYPDFLIPFKKLIDREKVFING